MSRISNLRLLTSHHLLSLEFSPFFEAVSPVPLLVEAEAPLETNGVSNWCDTQISFGSLDNPFGSRGNRPKMSMGASEEAKLWRLLSSNPLRPDFLGLSNLNFNFGSWSWPEIESWNCLIISKKLNFLDLFWLFHVFVLFTLKCGPATKENFLKSALATYRPIKERIFGYCCFWSSNQKHRLWFVKRPKRIS